MAEHIERESRRSSKGSRKKSTRVDLTPMVDLGFLLITFFVFTTALSQPKVMPMIAPKDNNKDSDKICESCALTVIPEENDQLFYYEGTQKNAAYKSTDYSAAGLRALLLKKKKEASLSGRDAVLIIRPGKHSTLRNLVNIIDESNIVAYKRYYLDEEERR